MLLPYNTTMNYRVSLVFLLLFFVVSTLHFVHGRRLNDRDAACSMGVRWRTRMCHRGGRKRSFAPLTKFKTSRQVRFYCTKKTFKKEFQKQTL